MTVYRTTESPSGRHKLLDSSAVSNSVKISDLPGICELPRPSAAPESLALWLVNLTEYPWQSRTSWLSTTEIKRAERFIAAEHQHRYLAAHCALRDLLSRQLHTSPELLSFTVGSNGKPRLLASPHGPRQRTHFNLSHSANLALLGISSEFDIGVDIEVHDQLAYLPQLVTTHLTEKEQFELTSLPPENHASAFLRVWTRKEACLKAVGCGLAVEPRSIHVGIGPSQLDTRVANDGQVTSLEVQSLNISLDAFAAVAWIKALCAPD